MSKYPEKTVRKKRSSKTNEDRPPKELKSHQKIQSSEIKLNQEQLEAEQLIHENDITLLTGKAGSGKTMLGCKVALDYLFNGTVKKIIVIRPAVATENHGFLKGSLEEKLYPWNLPVINNFRNLVEDQSIIDTLMNDRRLEMFTMMFGRGVTFCDSFIILDEFQNATDSQTKMMLSRIGKGSKMVICADTDQIDLKRHSESGIHFVQSFKMKNFAKKELTKNHRLDIVDKILDAYNKRDQFLKSNNTNLIEPVGSNGHSHL